MEFNISGSDYIPIDKVDGLRGEHETDEHWELRREFLVTHRSRFPYSRLLSLSQTYCNIQILGCRYNADIMQLINELSKDMGKARQARQEGGIQRYMVNASSAAEQKIRNRTRGQPQQNNQPKIFYGPPVTSGPRVVYGPPVSSTQKDVSRYGGGRKNNKNSY